MEIQSQIDKAVYAKFPNARKVDESVLEQLWYDDETTGLAYYILQELPNADEFGRSEELDEDVEEPTALTIWQHKNTGRVFFNLLNEFGESINSYGETDGEVLIEQAELFFEVAADCDID
jgi:hypothetical protein